jgi:subtilisin family serine protease
MFGSTEKFSLMMRYNRLLARFVLVSLPLLTLPLAHAQSGMRKLVKSQIDLPRFSYPVSSTASALLQSDDATFNAFAGKVRADLDSVLRDYDIPDHSTQRTLLVAKLNLQQVTGEYSGALETVAALRAIQDKPAAKLLTGILPRAWLQAAVETKSTSGAAFEKSFSQHYSAVINTLPWAVVSDSIKRSYVGARLSAQAVLVGDVMTELDPTIQKSGALSNEEAWDLVATRVTLQCFIPLASPRAEVLKQYIAAHNVEKPDIWGAREVTLTIDQKLTPVAVAIWDSGIDVSIFPNQLFTDPQPTASGTHGLAFDDDGQPSQTWLYPLTAAQQAAYPEHRDEIQGRLDIEDGRDSPQATALINKYRTSTPEQLHESFELEKVIGFYMHGTHCAGIAVRGNPAARLVVARFDDQLPDLPFAPTAEWANRLGAAFQQMSDLFRTRHVRVVNMSWGDDPEEFELWLSKTGGGGDPALRKQKAADLYKIWYQAVEAAIKGAPDTLFICAAGNSDQNAGFAGDVPASLHLPNLVAVGAVNQAGDETSFSSFGDTVAVNANGYEVESFVPGGARVKESGTSMASPNVVNLAAKLFALDPTLTPAQVIELIKSGASTSDDGRRHLIDEKHSVALLQAKGAK